MSNRRRQQAPGGARRRVLTAPVTIIGAGGLVVWGIGAADAATGGSFVLGKANSETSTAVLTNSKGIPLSLKAKSGSPPLTVNSSKLVARFNAAEVGGLSASKLQRRLGSAVCPTGIGNVTASGGVVCAHNELIFTSNGSFKVPANVTHVTGDLWSGGGAAGSDGYYPSNQGGGAQGGFAEVLITVTPGQTYDVAVGAGGQPVFGSDGGIGGTSSISLGPSHLVEVFGGAGGPVSGCGGTVNGGRAVLDTTTGILGLSEVSGDKGGDCVNGAGVADFVGSGGAPPQYGSGPGAAGEPGLVTISFSN